MFDFRIESKSGGEIEIYKNLPEFLSRYALSLPDVRSFAAVGNYGKMIFHHLPGSDFHIWYSQYAIKEPTRFKGAMNEPILELYISFRNHFESNWENIGTTTVQELEFNLSYSPWVNNVVFFPAAKTYETFDIHLSLSQLYYYAEHYDEIKKFVDNVQKERPSSLPFKGRLTRRMAAIIQEILSYRMKPSLHPRHLACQVELLLDHAFAALTRTTPQNIDLNSSTREKVIAARAIQEKRLNDPPTVKELAKLVCSNTKTLNSVYKEVFGKTIHEGQTEIRMELVKRLLLDTNYSLDSIAEETGYHDKSHLSNAFKNHFGQRPEVYRKKEDEKK